MIYRYNSVASGIKTVFTDLTSAVIMYNHIHCIYIYGYAVDGVRIHDVYKKDDSFDEGQSYNSFWFLYKRPFNALKHCMQ